MTTEHDITAPGDAAPSVEWTEPAPAHTALPWRVEKSGDVWRIIGPNEESIAYEPTCHLRDSGSFSVGNCCLDGDGRLKDVEKVATVIEARAILAESRA